MVSPSSKGKMPWQFVAVDDKATLEQLSKCKEFGARPIAGCALAVVVTANPYESDAWIEDASIAAFAIQMQAQDLGLGSCWIQVRERFDKDGKEAEDNVRELLNIPPDMRVLCIISIGHKNEERKPLEEENANGRRFTSDNGETNSGHWFWQRGDPLGDGCRRCGADLQSQLGKCRGSRRKVGCDATNSPSGLADADIYIVAVKDDAIAAVLESVPTRCRKACGCTLPAVSGNRCSTAWATTDMGCSIRCRLF